MFVSRLGVPAIGHADPSTRSRSGSVRPSASSISETRPVAGRSVFRHIRRVIDDVLAGSTPPRALRSSRELGRLPNIPRFGEQEMTTEIITIGSELLHGLVRNTNVDMISGILAERAFALVPHDRGRRSRVHRERSGPPSRGRVVDVTGGLSYSIHHAKGDRERLPQEVDPVPSWTGFARASNSAGSTCSDHEVQPGPPGDRDPELPGSAPGPHFTHLKTDASRSGVVRSAGDAPRLRDPFPKSRNPGSLSIDVRTIGVLIPGPRGSGIRAEEPDLIWDIAGPLIFSDRVLGRRDVAQAVLDPMNLYRLAYALGSGPFRCGRRGALHDSPIASGVVTGRERGGRPWSRPPAAPATTSERVAYSKESKETSSRFPGDLGRFGAVSAEVARKWRGGARERLALPAPCHDRNRGPDGAPRRSRRARPHGYSGPDGT